MTILKYEEVKVEVLPGSTIEDVALEVCSLALTKTCKVCFSFNGVHMMVKPRTKCHQVEKHYYNKLKNAGVYELVGGEDD